MLPYLGYPIDEGRIYCISELGVYGQPSPHQTHHETCLPANNGISLQLTKIPYHFAVSGTL